MRVLRVLLPLALACASRQVPAPEARLTFIEDDFPAALRAAREKGVPLFVDTWAPWCHTCRSMRAYVFPDPSLARHASRFVWLELNTDRPESAAFLEKYPVDFWPTLFVIDPRSGAALVRFGGSATVPQLEKLLEDGERAYRGDVRGAEAALARGDALYGEGKAAEAADAYARALAEAPPGWVRSGRAIESHAFALKGAGQHHACAVKTNALLGTLPQGSRSWGNAVTMAMFCALEVPGAEGRSARDALETWAKRALATPDMELSADDRSGLYEVLVESRALAEDVPGKKALAEEWLRFLEQEAARAKSPEARTVFDWHRVVAATALGQPQRVIPALEASERELPDDYSPPARLSNLYRMTGRLDDALFASDRALQRVGGGRRLRVLSDRADLHLARGELALARSTLQDALAYADALSKAHVSPRLRAALERKLAELERAPQG